MVENIKKVSERATTTEIQKICMLGSARILRKVLSVWTEWLTWVTDALGAWFAPGWCTKRTPAKTVIKEIIIVVVVIDFYGAFKELSLTLTITCICMYVRDSIRFCVLSHIMNESFEVLWVKIRPKRLPRGISSISIYTLSDLGDLSNLIGSLSRTT